ncbi:MAG: TonB-dependent receptor [Spirosomaceae bacterium]|nr:TonB-dependent receptor [Spirosomataceae bacterium]
MQSFTEIFSGFVISTKEPHRWSGFAIPIQEPPICNRLIFTFFLALSFISQAQTRHTISGYIREKGSQEQLIGVGVFVPNTTIGTASNTYGFYSLTLPAADSVTVAFSFVGYDTETRTFRLNKNMEFNIALNPLGRQLNEVVVSGRREADKVSQTAQMSQIDIPIQQIKKIPAFLGEKDVLRVIQLMPGVQKGSEGQTGIYVRGGGPDQNLILLDEAPVYNVSHLFGFFSVFNGDALKSVELTKGGFPARFGGRLSSVLELNMKEGNKEKLHGEGGGGLIASRVTLEGPLKTKKQSVAKSSFLVSGRRTYLDLLARPIIAASTEGAGNGGYYFYDLNAKVNYDFGQKDKVYLSGYFGQDRFFFRENSRNSSSEGGLNWGNATGTLRWNHLFSEKLFANTSLIFSNYKFQIYAKDSFGANQANEFELRYSSGVRDWGLKYDVDYFPNPQHALRFGVSSTLHRFTPSAVVLKDDQAAQFTSKVEAIDNVESGVYVEDTWKPNRWLKVNAGVRVSHFQADSQAYFRPEPRISAAFMLRPDLSFKASYARMNQYIHLLSNTGIGLPTDLWVPSTSKVAPQQSSQIAAGFAKDFEKAGLGLTIEGYYKEMNNIINYKEGASFLLIDDPTGADKIQWDDNVTSGRGWSYGAEVLLQKKTGRLSGWIGYTLSWTQWQFAELNFGEKFFPRYDRRHDLSLVGIYEISPRITLSGTWVYGTGNALTMPQSNYTALLHSSSSQVNTNAQGIPSFVYPSTRFGRSVSDYGPKNSFRAEPYHRFDLSLQFHKKKRRHERTWELSIYNLYNRRNPFFYNFTNRPVVDPNDNTKIVGNERVLQRISIFPIVPTLSYNFKF